MSRLCLTVLAVAVTLFGQTPTWASANDNLVPILDGKGRMLMEVVDTLERDLEHLGQQRRKLNRKKEQIEDKLARFQEQQNGVNRKLETAQGQIERLLRSVVHMKEPDDLLLLFSAVKYHELHLYRRLIRKITANLSVRLKDLVNNKKELSRRQASLKREMQMVNNAREGLLLEIAELEKLTKRRTRELTDRIAKIAAIENLFMTAALTGMDGHGIEVRTEVKVDLSKLESLAEIESKKSLIIPISPGRVVKGFEKLPADPYGTEKMVRGWILVPFVKGKKTKATDTAFVRVPHPGRIVFLGEVPGFGLTIIVDHHHGYHTVYSNLTRTQVVKGDMVTRTQSIATIKSDSPGKNLPYLYFEFRQNRIAVDPKPWFRLRPITPTER